MILAPDINIQTYFLTSLLSESVFDDVLKVRNGAVRDESVAVVVSDSAQSFIDCQQSAWLTGGGGCGWEGLSDREGRLGVDPDGASAICQWQAVLRFFNEVVRS